MFAQWIAEGLPRDTPVDICVVVSKPSQRHLTTTAASVAPVIEDNGISGCAILLVTWPQGVAKDAAMPKSVSRLRAPNEGSAA